MRATALSKTWRRPLAIPPNSTLTPFLYQTRTIQRPAIPILKSNTTDEPSQQAHNYVNNFLDKSNKEHRHIPLNQRLPKRSKGKNAGASREAPDHVPFAGSRALEVDRRPRSTITRQEKEAFGRLFNLVVTPEGGYRPKTAQDEQQEQTSLEEPQEEETAEKRASRLAERKKLDLKDDDFPEHFPAPLKYMAAEASRIVQEKEEEARLARELQAQEKYRIAKEKADAEALASDPLRQQQQAQIHRIKALLFAARSDVELWNVLETELFTPIELLDLDYQYPDADREAPSTENEQSEVHSTEANTSETILTGSFEPAVQKWENEDITLASQDGVDSQLSIDTPHESLEDSTRDHNIAIITHIYPVLLSSAISQLKTDFPSSPLPFSFLPRIKRLGRTSHILGASTSLYNEIISLTHTTYADFHRIDELLHELDNSGLEFDVRTLEVLERIAREGEKGRKGKLGLNLKQVWNMDVVVGGWKRVIEWIPIVRERVEEETVRKMTQKEERRQQAFAERNLV